MKYRRVTHEDRRLIGTLRDIGISQIEIARKLGLHKSTISREISRNRGKKGYRVKQACRLSDSRQSYRFRPRKMLPPLIGQIEKKLALKWSPEQISQRFKREKVPTVSAETIYTHIYKDRQLGGRLWSNLRWSHKRRKKRNPSPERRGKIPHAVPIHERSLKANRRQEKGHWERDTMIGKNRKTAVLALVDRKTRFNLFAKLNRKLALKVTQKTIALLASLPCRSITNDRGHEFADHQNLAKKLNVGVYFCDPYSSHQRGTNENRIGILRQYLPKKSDLATLHWKQLKKIEFEINNRPMKCLDWKTPYEAMMDKSCNTDL